MTRIQKTAIPALACLAAAAAFADSVPGQVFSLTNDVNNAVVMYQRGTDGSLAQAASYPTNGKGTAMALGSQGALALSEDGRWLAAVNAASNDVSLFTVNNNGLVFSGKAPSGGVMPISVTISRGLVFVVNAGGTPNILGFRIGHKGSLQPIPQSAQKLTGQAPAQIGFNPQGDQLFVTEKGTNTIEIFPVDNGFVSTPLSQLAHGTTPFGFGFDRVGRLIVSEAFGGVAGQTAASSYDVADTGKLTAITGSLRSGQTASCWIVVPRNGKFAYAANTPSATLTGFSVGRDGTLGLLASNGINATLPVGSAPTDMAITPDSRFLYTLNSGTGMIGIYRIGTDGTLGSMGAARGLPPNATGMVAR